jgi:hypothetical protein
MEQMVTYPDVGKVLVICDRAYAEKSEKRAGGVGIKSQIMSGEIYGKVEQTKFVPVIRERDASGSPYLPPFFKTRLYVDLSPEADLAYGMERLLRWCHDEPLDVAPEIGRKPSFVSPDAPTSPRAKLFASSELSGVPGPQRGKQAVENTRAFFAEVLTFLEQQDLTFDAERSPEDVVVERIDQMRPIANNVLSAVERALQAAEPAQAVDTLHDFLERLATLIRRLPKPHPWATDHLRFFSHYIFVQVVAAMIRDELFAEADHFLSRPFFKPSERGFTGSGTTYIQFMSAFESLTAYNRKQSQRILSFDADLIQRASEGTQFTFAEFMQADFLLWLRTFFTMDQHPSPQYWWPTSNLYSTFDFGAFPVFVRAASAEYWVRTVPLHKLSSHADAERFIERIKGDNHFVPRWEYERLEVLNLMNWEQVKRHVGM